MSDSRLLKRRDMQIIIKPLTVKYGTETTSTLRNSKHTGIETSSTRRWFYCSLSKQLIHFLLDNGMVCCSCLIIELLEITEQGRTWPKLKMVILNHIMHKPDGGILLHWSKNGKAYQPAKQKKIRRRLWTVIHQECQPPQLPFFLAPSQLADTLPPVTSCHLHKPQPDSPHESS